MGKYKRVREKFTVDEGLDTTEIESLRDEMQGWVDNMSGTALENTSRYQMAEEAVSQLDQVDGVDFDEIWGAVPEDCGITVDELKAIEFTCTIFTPKSRRQSTSRAYRLSNTITHITGALDAIRNYLEDKKDIEGISSVLDAVDGIESQVQDLDGVEFPGMYG